MNLRNNCVFLFLLCITSFTSFAEQYKITTVDYDIDGKTSKYALSQEVPVDTKTVFSKDDFLVYLETLTTNLNNQRVLEYATVTPFYLPEENGVIPVKLTIFAKDTFNVIALPYPKYDSNSGFVLKLKGKNYNFLGSMRTLNTDIVYSYEPDTNDNDIYKHNIGGNLGFSLPFKMGVFNSSFDTDFSLGYKLGDTKASLGLGLGLNNSYTINDIISVSFGISHSFKYDPYYEPWGDAFTQRESFSLSLPIVLATIPNWSKIIWSPNFTTTYTWDTNGITHSDFYSPTISIGQSISTGKVDWVGNFRKGFEISSSQSVGYNFKTDAFSPFFSFALSYFSAFSQVGPYLRFYGYNNLNGTTESGDRMRGIRDSYLDSDTAFICNFDLPIRIWQTDWVGYGFPGIFRFVDFEMQVSPFVDFAFSHNTTTGTRFNFKDTFWSGGIEIIGYPNKMRSIQGRISLGFDLVTCADLVGNKIGIVDKVIHRLFNTDWRTGSSKYELFLGIGLFY